MQKKFHEVEIGQSFVFYFDRHSAWRYKKLSDSKVECISCPRTEIVGQQVGNVYEYRYPDTLCQIMVY